jgi:purine-nucleoside/S-methyl-5'-thioadenosine phosphorylase / adenosine deaminase
VSGPELIEVATDAPARAVFTTRRGGVSVGALGTLNLGADRGDADSAVRANRQGLCDALGLEARDVSLGRQVHGARVRTLDAPSRPGLFTGALRGWPEGDAMATRRPGLGLVVLGADCLPVLLWRRDGPFVAAAHAGWRGLVGGVLAAAVRALSDDGRPERIGAAVGPGIGPCCYPVSADVRDRFAAAFGEAVVRAPAVDLAAAARAALVAAGVAPSAIVTVQACTSCEAERFYSFRRDGPPSGRQGGLVWATG